LKKALIVNQTFLKVQKFQRSYSI